jgi:peptidylprolyl isomerase
MNLNGSKQNDDKEMFSLFCLLKDNSVIVLSTTCNKFSNGASFEQYSGDHGISGKEGCVAQAKNGDTVRVRYALKLEDGTPIFSTSSENALQFTIGDGKVMKGFEEAVVGMKAGESKTVQVPADKAFGPHLDEMVLVVSRSRLPENLHPAMREQLQFRQPDGTVISLTVTDISEESVTLDANHPYSRRRSDF